MPDGDERTVPACVMHVGNATDPSCVLSAIFIYKKDTNSLTKSLPTINIGLREKTKKSTYLCNHPTALLRITNIKNIQTTFIHHEKDYSPARCLLHAGCERTGFLCHRTRFNDRRPSDRHTCRKRRTAFSAVRGADLNRPPAKASRMDGKTKSEK